MQSKRKLTSLVGREGIAGNRGAAVGREQEVAVVELDATFARLLGIADGTKVYLSQNRGDNWKLIYTLGWCQFTCGSSSGTYYQHRAIDSG
jgi:hypothetical protein